MIGRLPTTISIDGTAFEIRSDYRNILQIMCAFNDEELSVNERYEVMLRRLYVEHKRINAENYEEALGLLYIKKGQYENAVKAFGNEKCNNAALAQILVKDYTKAKATLAAVASAVAHVA